VNAPSTVSIDPTYDAVICSVSAGAPAEKH